MGLKVTIDDFGTGYSSMSYLRRMPMDSMKIDKSFIDDMVNDENARAIAEVIITLAHTLRKSVVAEGVETLDQLNLLRGWQCDTIQGYYFSEPLTTGTICRVYASAERGRSFKLGCNLYWTKLPAKSCALPALPYYIQLCPKQLITRHATAASTLSTVTTPF